jgi:hypothetical protein
MLVEKKKLHDERVAQHAILWHSVSRSDRKECFMKRSTHDVTFLVREDGKTLYGVKLGWDFAAEHEFGIEPLRRSFGIPGVFREGGRESVGIRARQATAVPAGLHLVHSTDAGNPYSMLLFRPNLTIDEITDEQYVDRYVSVVLRMHTYREQPLHAAWDERSFCLAVPSPHDAYLREVYAAINAQDVAIFVGPRRPFANGSLHLIIASRVLDEELAMIAENDRKQLALA